MYMTDMFLYSVKLKLSLNFTLLRLFLCFGGVYTSMTEQQYEF